ncbi:heat shock 70 kDa protein 12A-like isoform X1 [Ylistrum balloti]|uniref:heat shock 70 kDa protein 12A-like isoform X1 n=1 Tax=Ylistrum balloti TaxID=509963 RepID=UPI0029058904|nr:heat shock 70 kDa protein 12A-like isoform X1 [Ylistrum balloti]
MADCEKLLVAAIDFGTTYSGYAFSFRHDFENDPLKISASTWNAGSRALVSLKAPTTVLLDKNEKFHSFGYEAEDHYSQLAEDNDHLDWYYFRRFKMMLYGKEGKGGLSKKVMLKDIRDRELPALKVFSEAIKYLKGHLLMALDKRGAGVKESEIEWVLTVPAIWNDPAKQFMRVAAEEAGIKGDQLKIALEPEAASLYCKNLPVEKLGGSGQGFTCFSKGSKYLVLDAGGGTVDITVHEVEQDGHLKELDKASGGSWGGTTVDESFQQMLIKIVGNEVMQEFRSENTSDFVDMFREFETKKRTVDQTTKNKVTMKIPIALKELFETNTGEDLNETIEQTNYNGKLVWSGDKLRVHPETFRQLFSMALDSTIEHVLGLIAQKSCERTSTIIMVGGFSESPLLQSKIKESFSKMRVIIPPDAGLSVLKGAVIFGHTPRAIKARRAKYTYGVGSNSKFDSKIHDESRKFFNEDDKTYYCRNTFSKHVTKGDLLEIDVAQSDQPYSPMSLTQTSIMFPFFVSDDTNPKYCDEPNCEQIGKMSVNIPKGNKVSDRTVRVKLIFGGTEIKVEATVEHTKQVTEATLNYLD